MNAARQGATFTGPFSNGRAACVPGKAGGIQRPRFDPGLLVRHFTVVKVRQVTASEHEVSDPFGGGLLPAISLCSASEPRVKQVLRVIGPIRFAASIVSDFMSLDHSIEGLSIYFKKARSSLLVATRVRQYARDITPLNRR